jgi:hypothetical protein
MGLNFCGRRIFCTCVLIAVSKFGGRRIFYTCVLITVSKVIFISPMRSLMSLCPVLSFRRDLVDKKKIHE